MRETGRVLSAANGRAEVAVAARGECERCSAHGICNWTGNSMRRVLAVNRAGAAVGDTVELESAEGTGARSNLLVFGIPVLTMVAGVLIGGLLLRKDLWSGILSGVGLALGLGIVKAIDVASSRSGRSLPVIVGKAAGVRSQTEGETDEKADAGDVGRSLDNGVR